MTLESNSQTDPSQPKEYLRDLFQSHGLSCVIENDWVVPNSTLPALRAFWCPGESCGELQVQVLVREEVVIEECFAGFDNRDAGLRDALVNFTLNSFHVLLAALWQKSDLDQVNCEKWLVNGKPFIAYIGNFGTRISEGAQANVPPELFDQIQETVMRESLISDLHWFRFFGACLNNSFTFEALKDNESWESGVRCLEAASWEPSDKYYSVRLFMILRSE